MQEVMFIRNVWWSEMVRLLPREEDYVFRSEGEVGNLFVEGTRTLIEFDDDTGYVYPEDSYLPIPKGGKE